MDVRVIQDDTIYSSISAAIIILNRTAIEPGKAYSFRYRVGNRVDSLLAIGVSSGRGPTHYTLLTNQSTPVVQDIVYQMEDVSNLVYGQIYLYVKTESGEYSETSETGDYTNNYMGNERTKFYFLSIGENFSKDLTRIDYSMYFYNNRNRVLYFLDPVNEYLVDVSINLQGIQGIAERLDAIESSITRVSVRGNTLVFL